MALRQVQERIEKSATLCRPDKPMPDAPEYDSIHHDVHLAIVWLSETTLAPVDPAHHRFVVAHGGGSMLHPAELKAIAQEAMTYLISMSNDFPPANYEAIYSMLLRGTTLA